MVSVYDLLSGKREAALESMFNMSDILELDEKKIALEALKLSFMSNPIRSLDKQYVDAIRAMGPD